MNTIHQQETFTIIGIEARTNNANEKGPNGIISKQWEKFIKGNLLEVIPNKSDSSVIAGYTEYASDHNGDYTFVLGVRVTSTNQIPAGMVVKHIPAGKYEVFTSQKGPVWEVVLALWVKIWNSESIRAYKFDYEVYDQRASDPANATVDVHIGLR